MALPAYTMRQLLEAGVHFGHHTRRWNPKMSPYIFGVRNGIHIIDLEQTVPLLRQGLEALREVVAGGGRVLLVGTKRQAQEVVADAVDGAETGGHERPVFEGLQVREAALIAAHTSSSSRE